MFYGLENTQYVVAQTLENLINSNSFPSAILLSGPRYSGRMYAALCIVKSFKAQHSTVLLSNRNFSKDITCALTLFKHGRNKASREFLVNTLGIFLMQYNSTIIDAFSSSERKKFAEAGELSELLSGIESIGEDEYDSFCSKIEKKLSNFNINKISDVSVNQIREVRQWCSTSSNDGSMKIVIIEGLDYTSPSTSNSLLKILEEPPLNCCFIIISDKVSSIPTTVLSRVRKFSFIPFSEKEKDYVLNSLFVNSKEYKDLETFFIKYANVDDELLQECAKSIVDKRKYDEIKLISQLEQNQCWDRFFTHIIFYLNNKFSQDYLSAEKYRKLVEKINDIVYRGNAFNLTKRLLFDNVVNTIREALK